MTGYGRGVAESESHRVQVSLRSVNHRYLDLAMRLPEVYRSSEAAVRRRLQTRLARGRVEVAIAIEALSERSFEVIVRREVIEGLRSGLGSVEGMLGSASDLELADLLRVPAAIEVRQHPESWTSDDEQLLLECIDSAADHLIEARGREGNELRGALSQRLDELAQVLMTLRERRSELEQGAGERWRRRLTELLEDSVDLDESRVMHEAAVWVEKTDVAEELERLDTHHAAFEHALDDDGPVGKRLDFLAQEIHRELNTLASKARDSTLAAAVVDGKMACERLREQVQNVE